MNLKFEIENSAELDELKKIAAVVFQESKQSLSELISQSGLTQCRMNLHGNIAVVSGVYANEDGFKIERIPIWGTSIKNGILTFFVDLSKLDIKNPNSGEKVHTLAFEIEVE